MKLLAFLIPFFLLFWSFYAVGNLPETTCSSVGGVGNFQWLTLDINSGRFKKAKQWEKSLKELEGFCFSVPKDRSVNIYEDPGNNKCQGAGGKIIANNSRQLVLGCYIPNESLIGKASGTSIYESKRDKLLDNFRMCIRDEKQHGSQWQFQDRLPNEEAINDADNEEFISVLSDDKIRKSCDHPKKDACDKQLREGYFWDDYNTGNFSCRKRDSVVCETLDPNKDCAPKRTQNLTDVFIQGLGFMSAKSGNRCIALAVQSFPATRAYSNAVKKCEKGKKIACKKNKKDGKPQCKSCKDYKEQLEHVQAESAKMIFAYQEAINCAKQTKTDYNGSAEECNIVTTLNRDKCCFMPEHMNNSFCDDFGSEHSYSPNTGYVDKKGVAGVDGLDYMDDGLPFVSPQTKFDPSNPDYSPGFNPSDSSGPVGGGAGGSPYTGDNSGISGLGKKGLFKSYMQGASNRWGSNSKKNNKYYPSFSSSSKRNLKFKNNKNNKNGKNIKRSIASKRNRTIFERISDVYTSLVNKKKLFFKKGEK